jgi:hypothetical protein
MALNITYLRDVSDHSRFYSQDLVDQLSLLKNETAITGQLLVYPDAHFEGWGIPTGLFFLTSKQDALLLPTFLRDPGCGFLVFQVTFLSAPPSNWQMEIGAYLDAVIRKEYVSLPPCHPTMKPFRDNFFACSTLFSLEQLYSAESFHAALEKQGLTDITEDECYAVWRSLGAVTNGIELRTCEPCKTLVKNDIDASNGMIGFVHCGSTSFPKILEDRFAFRCAEFALDSRLFSYQAVEKGIFGVPFLSSLGEEYARWLRAAARVATFNRSIVFQSIKQHLELALPCCVSELSNVSHCGFEVDRNGDLRLYRGVQPMAGPELGGRQRWPLTFVAGHRETTAALVLSGDNSAHYSNMISHGTSWVDHDGAWKANRWSLSLETSRRRAVSAYYNTKPDFDKVIPYTLNLLDALALFESIGIAQTVSLCQPLINIQGEDVIESLGGHDLEN